MATQGAYLWSTSAASNASADPAVNWAEGQSPSSVNDSARGMMASFAKYRDDQHGLTTSGSETAYTVATNATFAAAADMDGVVFSIIPHATSGATPTLAVDGLTARALNVAPGVAASTGSLVEGVAYKVRYVHASTEFVFEGSASNFPTGTAMLFQQTTAPAGWTKSTTHNNKALRIVSGTASSGGSTAFTTVFASRTIARVNLPAEAPTFTGTQQTWSTNQGGVPANTSATNVAPDAGQAVVTYGGFSSQLTVNVTPAGTIANLGSGTAMDFAVQYVDVIIATKD